MTSAEGAENQDRPSDAGPAQFPSLPSQCDPTRVAIVLVDHGSRRPASNQLLLAAVERFQQATPWSIVEPAHMELAEPSIDSAFARCVEAGAQLVVVFPYFLSPGRHWSEDIPRLAAEAAQRHPGLRHLVTAPFGLHPLLMQAIEDRIAHCLAQAQGDAQPCDICSDDAPCRVR